ncbi:MAG: hypothetical protein QW493_04870 [Candidatus Bathyarchaeia archaeon]
MKKDSFSPKESKEELAQNPFQDQLSLSSSTTSTLGRVRGFTITLLYLLYEEQQRGCELAEKTGKKQDYVRPYLKRMQNYGLVEKNGAFWHITDFGVSFVEYLKRHYNLLNSNIKEYGQKRNRNITEIGQKRNTLQSKIIKQASLAVWLQDSDLKEAEKKVVEVLVDHYNRTGSKFLYFVTVYDVAEKFHIRPEDVNKILMNLKQDHIVYTVRDRVHNAFKIGLYEAFIEALTKCESQV